MSNYPSSLDDDSTIYHISDNISELGTEVINQLRDAMFSVEEALGINIAGAKNSLAERIDVSLNPDGTIKAAALTSVGLATLPIDNTQVGVNAGILESKLALDYSTSDLNTLIQANTVLLTALSGFFAELEIKVNSHIAGGPAANLRHVASHIDLNAVPTDTRDSVFNWNGLKDKDGYSLTAGNVAEALDQINTNLTGHQNQITDAHRSTAISVDSSSFTELSNDSTNLQQVLINIDQVEELQLGTHRAIQHSSGIPKDARSVVLSTVGNVFDGYNLTVVSDTPIVAHSAHPPGTAPIDSVTVGDNVISFIPTNTNFTFDAQFSQVRVGDVIHVNYGSGIEDIRKIDSIRFIPGSEWVIRINGTNLRDTDGYSDGYSDGYIALAKITRPQFDQNTYGVLAVAAANATPLASYTNILGGVIIGDPKAATALGIGFNVNQLDANHYNLYLQLYPTGDPVEKTIDLPAIDVTGNLGVTPGKYTLNDVVQNVNNKFREIGFNFRFIAFTMNGCFGIMLSDSIDGAAFSIVSGINSSGSLTVGPYVKNVISNANADNFDALGFGFNKGDLASPAYQGSWIDATSAQIPTKIIHPLKRRNYIVNGKSFNNFKKKPLTTDEGYWAAEILSRTPSGGTVEVTYKVDLLLTDVGLKPGKTITIQPAIAFDDGLYNNVDYGRFIIKDVIYNNCNDASTLITVINGLHAFGSGVGSSAAPGLPVRLFFGEDSVGFDDTNLIDAFPTGLNYHRHFEIYITDQETTFSHERARLPFQTETLELLNTSYWNINSVSAKLRGYRDTGSTSFKKFVRLYILSYDATSGEFDGYIGQRVPSTLNVIRTGPIVTGRKNVSTRFYDETNVDYIDLEFNEISTFSPGLTIAPGARYVDIELFTSEKLDDEVLLLATCEVNWQPDVGYNIVERVIDCRAKGSISELEFTQSAVDFITAGERFLHNNGVIRGFDYTGVNSSDHRELFFTGGLALVNGKIIALNNNSVTIPQVTKISVPPQTLDWAICVDELGNLISLPLTSTKIHFFARDTITTNQYYIQSVSFSELANNRPDLTLVAVANITIASFTVNSVTDSRKYVAKETNSIPLTLVSDNSLIGHFYSFTQAKQWIKNLGLVRNTLKVKGTFPILTAVDFSDIGTQLTIDGSDGVTFNIISPNCFKTSGSNGFIVKNCNFNYNPVDISYISNDNLNLKSSRGCIFATSTVAIPLKNITIDNCSFVSSISTQRPPYIALNLEDGSLSSDIKISNNLFDDIANSISQQCSIAIVTTNVGTNTASLFNTKIYNNTCKQFQSIVITPGGDSGGSQYGKIFCSNVNIEDNSAGAIGFLTSSRQVSYENVYTNNLNIVGNTCFYIGQMYPDGKTSFTFGVAGTLNQATGNVNIDRNHCCVIYPAIGNDADYSPNAMISNNIVQSNALLEYFTDINHAIFVKNYASVDDTGTSNIEICGNKVIKNASATLYTDCIHIVAGNSQIYNNVLGTFDGYGISINNILSGTPNHIIHSNTFIPGEVDVLSYIFCGSGSTTGSITGNSLDDPTIDGSDTNVIQINAANFEKWVVEKNKNQTEIMSLSPVVAAATFSKNFSGIGTFTLGSFEAFDSYILYVVAGRIDSASVGGTQLKSRIVYDAFNAEITTADTNTRSDDKIIFHYLDEGTSDAVKFTWRINLLELLPKNVNIISVSCSAEVDGVFDTTGLFHVEITSNGARQFGTLDFKTDLSGTVDLTLPSTGYRNSVSYVPVISIWLDAKHTTDAVVTKINSLVITYRY
jgi:hypothetical protein